MPSPPPVAVFVAAVGVGVGFGISVAVGVGVVVAVATAAVNIGVAVGVGVATTVLLADGQIVQPASRPPGGSTDRGLRGGLRHHALCRPHGLPPRPAVRSQWRSKPAVPKPPDPPAYV